jgi:hypothetical protein
MIIAFMANNAANIVIAHKPCGFSSKPLFGASKESISAPHLSPNML